MEEVTIVLFNCIENKQHNIIIDMRNQFPSQL